MDADIAIAGCGIAGLEAALRLERRGIGCTVIDPADSTTFYPSLHRLFGGASVADTQIDLERKFAGRDIRHLQETVTGADVAENSITLADGRTVTYDTLVVAVGAETQYGTLEGTGNVHDLRFRDDALAIHEALAGDVTEVVIVGGGATGVEAVASLTGHDRFAELEVTIVEGGDRLLQQFPSAVGAVARTRFENRGIDMRVGTYVDRITAGAVELVDGTSIPSDLTIWAGGVAPRPVLDDMGLPTTRGGVPVDDSLRVTDREDVVIIGDAADYPGKVNRAFYAIKEARTAARNIGRSRAGRDPVPHEIGWDPNLVQIGPHEAIFEFGGRCWSGVLPYLMRTIGVEKRYLLTRRHLL